MSSFHYQHDLENKKKSNVDLYRLLDKTGNKAKDKKKETRNDGAEPTIGFGSTLPLPGGGMLHNETNLS